MANSRQTPQNHSGTNKGARAQLHHQTVRYTRTVSSIAQVPCSLRKHCFAETR